MKQFTLVVLATLITATSSLVTKAQSSTRTITGIVRSAEEHEPLEGVFIAVKGTKNSSGTQPDGIYYIQIQATDSVLSFSFPGYQTVELKITASNEYNVELKKATAPSYSPDSHNLIAFAYNNKQPFLIRKPD